MKTSTKQMLLVGLLAPLLAPPCGAQPHRSGQWSLHLIQTPDMGTAPRDEGLAVPAIDFGTATPFQDGDRVAFAGDSITKADIYGSYIQLFYATRFPKRTISIYNAGVGGDRASAIVSAASFRVQTDIWGEKPTVVTLMLGMNDVERNAYKPGQTEEAQQAALKLYETMMSELITQLKASGARLILLTPSIYDETTQAPAPTAAANVGVNGALGQASALVKGWATQYGTELANFYDPMNALNAREQARDATFSLLGAGKNWNDRVHPGPVGNLVMAYALLRAQHIACDVARIEVDAITQKVNQSINATVTGVARTDQGIEFDYLANAIPFVPPVAAATALQLVPFNKELNQGLVIVRGLAAGDYELKIDGQAVGTYSAAQWEAGVNFSDNPKSPQYKQAAKAALLSETVRQASEDQRELATTKYGMAKLGLDPKDNAAVEKYLTALVEKNKTADGKIPGWLVVPLKDLANPGQMERQYETLSAQLLAACQPLPHHFSISNR